MRVINKQRRVSNIRQAKHLVWTSDTHKQDQNKADVIRASVGVESPWVRKRISDGAKIASQVVFQENTGKEVSGQEFESFVSKEAKKRSWYMSSNRKRKVKGIIDTYCSIPPWWGRVLNEELEAGRMTPEQVKTICLQLAKIGMEQLRKRTGYEAVYVSVHPESENNMHIHFGVANISNSNNLIGRSANGKVGKKGLRHAGDCNLALLRMYQIVPHANLRIGAKKAMGQQFDDVALASAMDSHIASMLPDLHTKAMTYAKEHTLKWIKNAEEKKIVNPQGLKAENERLKKENDQLKRDIQNLRDKLLEVSID